MDYPFLSIIIPFFNAASFLPETFGSIQKADIPDAEILLIDDGSTDASREICSSFSLQSAAPVRLLCQENRGPSAARNLGLDACRGDCVVFLDADDVIDPANFRRAVSAMRDTGAELLATDFTRISRDGCVLDRICQIEQTERPITDPAYMLRFLSDGEVVWNVWRYLFRRDFLLRNDLRFIEDVNCAEDLEFMIRALTVCEHPAFLHAPYYAYRVHYGNTLTQRLSARRVEDLMHMLRISAAYLKGLDAPAARMLENKLAKEYLLNLAILEEIPRSERGEALAACRDAQSVLNGAQTRLIRAAAAFTRLVGLPFAARLLMMMKKLKRAHRKRKIRCYEKKTK